MASYFGRKGVNASLPYAHRRAAKAYPMHALSAGDTPWPNYDRHGALPYMLRPTMMPSHMGSIDRRGRQDDPKHLTEASA